MNESVAYSSMYVCRGEWIFFLNNIWLLHACTSMFAEVKPQVHKDNDSCGKEMLPSFSMLSFDLQKIVLEVKIEIFDLMV